LQFNNKIDQKTTESLLTNRNDTREEEEEEEEEENVNLRKNLDRISSLR